jgi:3-deoxy-manno-octulosonate cytidylyltransferase (CMP-KDO synthetase)
MNALAVIPARFASTRFPGKPLAHRTGKYLIQHVYERASRCASVDRVVVATDDERIREAVESFGGDVVMTRTDHPTGTDRVAEVSAQIESEIVVNVQGDEPEVDPAHIDRLIESLQADREAMIATLACPFAVLDGADPRDPNAVKVVVDGFGRAIYFSRAMIPYPRGFETTGATHQPAPYLLHLGVYAYRSAFLKEIQTLPPTPLERTEKLEQLRWIEHGYRIAVRLVDRAAVGIDTPEDYEAFVKRAGAADASILNQKK